MESAAVELLQQVLAPFEDEDRAEMIAWMEAELKTQAITDDLQDHVSGYHWQLVGVTPAQAEREGGGAVVFAMLFHEGLRAFFIYSCHRAETGQTSEDGQPILAFSYYKEIAFGGGFSSHGPISPEALHADLRQFAEEAEDPEPQKKTNGAAQLPAGG
jgi:hypothetical protein